MVSLKDNARRIAAYPGLWALVAGGAAACGFQPLALWPLTILGIAVLIELTARAPRGSRAFLIGWLFGAAHFTVGNNWIATAFVYQSEMPTWLGAIAVVLIAFYLALFPGFAALGAWHFVKRLTLAAPAANTSPLPYYGLAFTALWMLTEWLRGWMLTGFGWNPLGIALLGGFDAQGLALTAKWIGTYALSGLLVGIAAAGRRIVRLAIGAQPNRRAALLAGLVAPVVLLAALMTSSATYLDRPEGARPYTLIQPDLRQEDLDVPSLYEVHFQKMAGLTEAKRARERRIVFWPESGLPDYLRDGYRERHYRRTTYAADPKQARERVGDVIGPYSLLLTGVVDLVMDDGRAVAARNSVTAVDYKGRILAGYSKAHLVPFGEYLPARGLLEPIGLSRFVAGSLDFWPGPGPRTYDFGPWGKAGIQICYEIVFSGEVVDPMVRPEYIFNPSNDGWFGSWGPPQHLAQARLRAIEEGLPILRSTTTGISATIDADGIVRDFIPRHRPGRIDAMIPPPAEPTLFSRLGNAIPVTLAILLLALCAVALRRDSR